MKKGKVLLFLLMCFVSISAQSNRINDLKNSLSESSPDSLRIRTYIQLCKEYTYQDFDTSSYYGQLAYDLSQKNNFTELGYWSLLELGYLHLRTGSLKKSIEVVDSSLNISKVLKDTALMARAINLMGEGHWGLNQNHQALQCFQNAHDWSLSSNDKYLYILALNNLGLINSNLGREEEAIRYFKKMKKLSVGFDNFQGDYLGFLNIANSHRKMGKYDLAYEGFQKAIEIIRSSENYYSVANTYYNMGLLLNQQKKYQAALDSIEITIDLCTKYGLEDLWNNAYYVKSIALNGLKRYDEATEIAQKGMIRAAAIGADYYLFDFYGILAEGYEGQGEIEKAFNCQKKYATLQDSLFLVDKQNEIARLEISFQSKHKDAENKMLKNEKETQAVLLQQRMRVLVMVSMVGILLCIIAFQLFLARRKSKLVNQSLEEKVKNRTEELKDSNDKLMESNDELKRFAYIASHDLKEPLRNIGGFMSLIDRRIKQEEYDSLPEYIDFVKKSNEQMVNLVDSILEYSKLEIKEKRKKEKINLKEEVENILTLLKTSTTDRDVQIHFNNLPTILFYPSVFKIILKNLIENGIKYNQSSEPTIHINHKIEGDFFQLIVSDNGIGIAPQFHEKIFEMFARLNNRSEYSGTGMGLAFCRKLLRKNGGDIKVESEEGQGCKFIVTIPANIDTENDVVHGFSVSELN